MERPSRRVMLAAAGAAAVLAAGLALLLARQRGKGGGRMEPGRTGRPEEGGPGTGEQAHAGPTAREPAVPGVEEVPVAEIHLPGPSIWPLALAAGLTLLALGVVTNPAFAVLGALLTAASIVMWIVELRRA